MRVLDALGGINNEIYGQKQEKYNTATTKNTFRTRIALTRVAESCQMLTSSHDSNAVQKHRVKKTKFNVINCHTGEIPNAESCT